MTQPSQHLDDRVPRPSLKTSGTLLLVGFFLFVENSQFGGPALLVADALCSATLLSLAAPLVRKSIQTSWPLLLLPAWAVISICWSSDPLSTARYGVQLALTCLGGVAIASLVSPRRFVLLLFGATFLFALVCIASRRTGPAADGMVLVGLTGSKNQLSYVGQMLISTALAVGVDRERRLGARALTLPALVIGAYLVLVTKSATGVLTAALAAALFIGFVVYRATAPSLRAWLLIATGVAALGLGMAGVVAVGGGGLDTFRRDVLHKDATLTGRTLLWSVASDAIAQRPVLGHGYKAFWTSGDTDAVGLLRSVNVTDARGFGFQDTYREVTVDLGITGLALLALATVPAFLRLLGREFSQPDHVAAFLAVTAIIFVIRSTVDMSVEPMYIYTTLIYALCGYGLRTHSLATSAAPVLVMEPVPDHAV